MCTSCVQYSIASDDAEAEGHDVVWSKYLNLTFPKRFRHPPHTDEWFAKTPPHRQRVGLHTVHPIVHTRRQWRTDAWIGRPCWRTSQDQSTKNCCCATSI